MKLLYTSDLHGNESHYGRLITLATSAKPDIIVLGGDLLPDDSALTPAQMGRGQPQFVRAQFRKFISDIRRASDCKHVLVIFGNHDWGSSVEAMKELAKDGLVSILDPKNAVTIDGLSFMGYSCTPPTPWYVKDFERLDQQGDVPPLLGGARWDARFTRPGTHSANVLFKQLHVTIAEELAGFQPPPAPWVFVAHAPPHDSKLDLMFNQQPAGSKSIRTAIEKHQPLLSLHGHIHESPRVSGQFKSEIGKTVAANAGQEQDCTHYLLIDIDVAARAIRKLDHGQQA